MTHQPRQIVTAWSSFRLISNEECHVLENSIFKNTRDFYDATSSLSLIGDLGCRVPTARRRVLMTRQQSTADS
jgi:hypothetical protein